MIECGFKCQSLTLLDFIKVLRSEEETKNNSCLLGAEIESESLIWTGAMGYLFIKIIIFIYPWLS